MPTLIQGSKTTKNQVRALGAMLQQRGLPIYYYERKYWAAFRSQRSNRILGFANPMKTKTRLLLAMEVEAAPDLLPTPARAGWGQRYSAMFEMEDDSHVRRAAELIEMAYQLDHRQ